MKRDLHVRGVPGEVYTALAEEAAKYHRSLSAQVVTILEGHVKQQQPKVNWDDVDPFEDNYSRADEARDQANADYWDEVAKTKH